eukprot:symbB.v1.2.029797.t1/scaffold3299.1/size59503/2
MMTCLTAYGCAFLLVDISWDYYILFNSRLAENDESRREFYSVIADICNYGWFLQLTIVNAIVATVLVLLKIQKTGFDRQRDMMQFESLNLAHCSNPWDEKRIRDAIAGAEDEVETVIGLLLRAGAYTENLRRLWDAGLEIDREGFQDARTGVCFCMLIWLVAVADNISDTVLGHSAHQIYLYILSVMFAMSTMAIPLSVAWVEGHGPDRPVFALKVWGLFGSLCLLLPFRIPFSKMDLALDLHRRVPPERWCITRAEFDEFVEEVFFCWHANEIPENPQHPNPLHWNAHHGPNLYDVNTHVVKPRTRAAGGMSYALMKHPNGLDCEVFVSHSWHGGIFHLKRGVNRGWPEMHQRRNLYCCLLANPQNLDLDEFLGGDLTETPFALALQKASHLLVVPNPSVGVYSRLWCVYEARWTMCFGWSAKLGGLCLSHSYSHCAAFGTSLPGKALDTPCMMTCLTAYGCAFLLVDISWDYYILFNSRLAENDESRREFYSVIADICNYGWFLQLTIVNAIVATVLVLLKIQKTGFDRQRDMMQFESLNLAHCSNPWDEKRIRDAIAGAEDEVETVIGLLLRAGAYTENLRRLWDAGLEIDREGFQDARTGVCFCMLIWLVAVADNISDTVLGHSAHQIYLYILSVMFAMSTMAIPLSVAWVEGHGPDRPVFVLKVWGLFGSLCLFLPLLLSYAQGYDQSEGNWLESFFNQTNAQQEDWHEDWHKWYRMPMLVSGTTLFIRFLCTFLAWLVLCVGLERWNTLRIKLAQHSTWKSCTDKIPKYSKFSAAMCHRDTPAGNIYFPTLTQGMFALFFHGCLGEQLPEMAHGIFDEGIDVGICLMVFIFLGPFTVMNMIVAVLVHVVSSVATLQQISQQNGIIRERVYGVLKELDTDNDEIISQDEFRTILDQKEHLHTFLGCGVDVISIIKDPDIVFGGEHNLPIDEVMDEVIALRGSNFTTVKDLVQLKNQMVREIRRVHMNQRRFLTTR